MAHQALNYSDQFLYALVLIRAGSVHACKRASVLVNDGGALHSPQCAFRAARVVRYLSLGAMAQLVARLVRNEKVGGSNPPSSTICTHFWIQGSQPLAVSVWGLPDNLCVYWWRVVLF